jgi:hypothetical protein
LNVGVAGNLTVIWSVTCVEPVRLLPVTT